MNREKPDHFIQKIIKDDIASGKTPQIITRFPPEPNGYLHIGHAKAICLNFGLAQQFNGRCNLRFDDTNPETIKDEYINAIQEDIKWLGFDWGEHLYYASDYFPQLYEWAVFLIKKNLAFVDDSSPSEIQKMRGSFTVPGQNSRFRNRSVEENLELFEKMKAGKFEDGSRVLRAKIDMSSGNMNFRDPILYRIIKKTPHHRTGHTWSIYPTYDFAHGQSDAIEKITHSLCTLEFADHNPLYDWFLEKLEIPNPPRQFEFDRLNLDHTILSKRHLLDLVENKEVKGWDDQRMPTLKGMRHRGYPQSAICNLCNLIGITRDKSTIRISNLEDLTRKELDATSSRLMAVLDPIKITITNYDKESEMLSAKKHPKNPELGRRDIPFSKNILIERSDFENKFNKKGDHIRLKYGYVIQHNKINKDGVVECCYYEETKGGKPPDQKRGLKPKEKPPIVHWVCQKTSHKIRVHHYDYLFYWWKGNEEFLSGNHKNFFDKKSLITIPEAKIEQSADSLKDKKETVQFERLGYYIFDKEDDSFHRIVPLTKPITDPYDIEDKLEKNFPEQIIFKYWRIYQDLKKSEMVEKEKIKLKSGDNVGFKIFQNHLEERRIYELPHLIEPWLSCLNQYMITPHSYLIKKRLNKETSLETSKKLLERIDTLLNLLNLVVISKSKEDLKNYFHEFEKNQLCIQVENVTKDFKEFIEEKIIKLVSKIKTFSEQYNPKTCTIKGVEAILEDFIIFIGRYYFIMSSMIYIHRGATPEHSTLGDIKKMMLYFSKPEAWQSNPSNEWREELRKYIESL